MFDPAGDNMALGRIGSQGRMNSGAVAFCAAAGEDDFVRLGADQVGDLSPGFSDFGPDVAADRVHT